MRKFSGSVDSRRARLLKAAAFINQQTLLTRAVLTHEDVWHWNGSFLISTVSLCTEGSTSGLLNCVYMCACLSALAVAEQNGCDSVLLGGGLKGGGGTSHLGWRLLGEIKQFSLCCVSLSITASSRSPVFGARQAAHFLSSFCFVFVCGSFCSSLSLSFPLLLLLLVLLPSILPARDTLSLSFRLFLYFITSPPPLLCFSPFRPLDIQLILLADSPDGTHTHTHQTTPKTQTEYCQPLTHR